MKKFMKTAILQMVLIVFLFLLISCGDSSSENTGYGDTDVVTQSVKDIKSFDGYFYVPQDGDQQGGQVCNHTEINNPDLSDYEETDVDYNWWSGTEMVSGVLTLKRYSSIDGFGANHHSITYQAVIDNELRTYKQDYYLEGTLKVGSVVYDPYLAVPLDLMPGQTFTTAFTVRKSDDDYPYQVEKTYSEVAHLTEALTTYFGTYDDCIRFTITTEYTFTNFPALSSMEESMEWYCRGAGIVRQQSIREGEDGYTVTSDYDLSYYGD